MSPIRIPAALSVRFFPESDAITIEEYHRLSPADPVPLQRPPQPTRMACAHCGVLFLPHPLNRHPRFCSSPCRRKFHARLSKLRKAAA